MTDHSYYQKILEDAGYTVVDPPKMSLEEFLRQIDVDDYDHEALRSFRNKLVGHLAAVKKFPSANPYQRGQDDELESLARVFAVAYKNDPSYFRLDS